MARIPRGQFLPAGLMLVLKPFYGVLLNPAVLRGLWLAALGAAVLGILNVGARWSVLVLSLLNLLHYSLVIFPRPTRTKACGLLMPALSWRPGCCSSIAMHARPASGQTTRRPSSSSPRWACCCVTR